jgi:hypothetical protein
MKKKIFFLETFCKRKFFVSIVVVFYDVKYNSKYVHFHFIFFSAILSLPAALATVDGLKPSALG